MTETRTGRLPIFALPCVSPEAAQAFATQLTGQGVQVIKVDTRFVHFVADRSGVPWERAADAVILKLAYESEVCDAVEKFLRQQRKWRA